MFKNNIKISILTPTFNSEKTIKDTLDSVSEQSYKNVEHIIIDGKSKDKTLDIISKHKIGKMKYISESDRGIYDAMNKGIKLASGDVVGILNSDDFYFHNKVIENVVKAMKDSGSDVCWGDLIYVGKENTNKVIRYWRSSGYTVGKFRKGWVPPHPTFFVKKKIYDKCGLFNLNFRIAADYEIMLRFLEKYNVKSCYIPGVMVKMRIGGKSNKNFSNILIGARECYNAWKINDLKINPLVPLILRPINKLPQYFNRYLYKINQ
jgi:glycosyltransferase